MMICWWYNAIKTQHLTRGNLHARYKYSTNLAGIEVFQQMFTSQQFKVLSFGDIDVDLWYKSTHPLQNVRYIFSPMLLVLQWMQTRVSSYYSRYSFCCFHIAASLVGQHSLRRWQLLLGPIYNIALHRRGRAEWTPVQHTDECLNARSTEFPLEPIWHNSMWDCL